jgi:glutathione S-transferase
MRLYSDRHAPNPRRVRMFAAEKGIALDIVEVSIANREHEADAFRSLNPRAEVPVLELDDGRRLTESLAICRYLEALQPEPNLWGRDALERHEVDAMVDALQSNLYVSTAHTFRHGHAFWAGRIEQCADYAPVARRAAEREYARLDALLADRDFLCLGRLTMADIAAYTTVEFGKVAGLRPEAGLSHLQRWRATIGARPSARA